MRQFKYLSVLIIACSFVFTSCNDDDTMEMPMPTQDILEIDVTNFKINNSSAIIGTNTNATNGVIHVINKVLLP